MATYVDRFIEAERQGLVKQWLYSYSPKGTTRDRRYVFIPANRDDATSMVGTMTLFHREVGRYLSRLGV